MGDKQRIPPWAHPVTYWQLKCTKCEHIAGSYGDDYSAMSDWESLSAAAPFEWHVDGDEALCPSCSGIDNGAG